MGQKTKVESKPVGEARDGRKQLGSRVDPDLLHHIRVEAAKRGTSVTVLVNEALVQKFGKPKPKARRKSEPEADLASMAS